MKSLTKFFFFIQSILLITGCSAGDKTPVDLDQDGAPQTGSVIFIHPDGSGANMWGAMRLLKVGPDGNTNWDEMDHLGLYRSHQLNSTNSSSHAGATTHAYGVKVPYNTYGNNPVRPFRSASSSYFSIMTEARDAGFTTALVNSGHLCEPGTGVFVANSNDRYNYDTVSEQIIHSGTDIMLSGGEIYLLPEGITGRHGEEGVRKDGRNLIEEAMQLGYHVVFTRQELLDLSPVSEKVLGIFAARHTFNDMTEEALAESGKPFYNPEAPSVGEMTRMALTFLESAGKQFLLVVEEEGTDNFANENNAAGSLEALKRADDAIGVAMGFIAKNPHTLLITTADSDACGMQVENIRWEDRFELPLPETAGNGSPMDGRGGTATKPFIAKPNDNGDELRFGIVWASGEDVAGGIIAKAHGMNAKYLPANVDNTVIYRMMYRTLFGEVIE